ncbi:MAG TPA: hypothetical protein VMF66_13055 [Candidatus Acidoferrum sp.]|nr:hypothetical protein [Candidatus Acidoferrum sp.]
MLSFWRLPRALRVLYFAAPILACGCLLLAASAAQNSSKQEQAAVQSPPQAAAQQPQGPVSQYDESIFEKRIPAEQTAFLTGFAQAPSGTVVRDKQFRKLMHSFVPDCIFHYGRDMSLPDALDMMLNNSFQPVVIRRGQYVTVAGRPGPYLKGRAFLWIDTREGIGLGGFFFHPTNGEPTPSVAVFSRQVKTQDKSLGISQLPPEFVNDLNKWSDATGLPTLTTTYFITGSNKRILLEHDEDYCATGSTTPLSSADACEQMNADAADLDLTAAYYLREVNYATNATAWMIPGDQTAWIGVRNSACGSMADPLACRIRMTREHVHVIVGRVPPPHRAPPIR